MRRSLLLLAPALALAGVSTASAQSLQWTGHYYIAVGEAAAGPAAVVGYHAGWSAPARLDAFGAGEFVDFALTTTPRLSNSIVPDHRYDVLAVGLTREGPVSVEGFESEGAPYFGAAAVRIPGIGAPHAVVAGEGDYLVVATRSPEGPVLRGDYVIAHGTHGKWEVLPGPDFRGGQFVDLAFAPNQPGVNARRSLVAIGMLNGQAVSLRGTLADGRPQFSDYLEPLPLINRPISVQWTGAYYVVMGLNADDEIVLVYGMPGAWNDSKAWVANGMVPSDLAVAPVVSDDKGSKRFDLLAIGVVKDLVATINGEDAGGYPMLFAEWAIVPLGGTPGVAPAPEAFAHASAATTVTSPSPNPFARATTLTLTLAREQAVLVEVFDAIGRRVTMLHNGILAAGVERAFTFEASGLPSGTYHFRINGVDFSEVRTVTLAR